MTLYADKEYYSSIFNGKKITGEEIEKYLELSQEKIDTITFNRIVKIGFNNLTDFQKEKIQKAICYQAEYIYENGYNDENQSDISSYSVLDISVSIKDNSNSKTQAQEECMSEIAYDLIRKTGLSCGVI